MRCDLGDVLTLTTGRNLFFSRKGVFALASFLINSPVEASETNRSRPALRETLISAHPQLPGAAEYLDLPSGVPIERAFAYWQGLLGQTFEVAESLRGSVIFLASEGVYRPRWLNALAIERTSDQRAKARTVQNEIGTSNSSTATAGRPLSPKTVLMQSEKPLSESTPASELTKRIARLRVTSKPNGVRTVRMVTTILPVVPMISPLLGLTQLAGRAGRMGGPGRETCDA